MLDAVTTEETSLMLQASWARRFWRKWIANILGDLENRNVLQTLHLIVPSDDAEVTENQEADAKLFFGLTVRTAAQRAWMMLSQHDLQPSSWKGVFHPDPTESLSAWRETRADALAVQKAVAALAVRDHPEREEAQLNSRGF